MKTKPAYPSNPHNIPVSPVKEITAYLTGKTTLEHARQAVDTWATLAQNRANHPSYLHKGSILPTSIIKRIYYDMKEHDPTNPLIPDIAQALKILKQHQLKRYLRPLTQPQT